MDLKKTWEKYEARHDMDKAEWLDGLGNYLKEVANYRTAHVQRWVSVNLERFKTANTNIEMLHRQMENAIVDLQANVELCRMGCSQCSFNCTLSRRHDPTQQPHDCGTDHQCHHPCDYADAHPGGVKACGSPYDFLWLGLTTANVS